MGDYRGECRLWGRGSSKCPSKIKQNNFYLVAVEKIGFSPHLRDKILQQPGDEVCPSVLAWDTRIIQEIMN